MKKIFFLFVFLLAGSVAKAQYMVDSVQIRTIANEILMHGTCYDNLRILCKTIGHRLSGSAAAAKAVAWAEMALEDAGADRVFLQPVYVPHWVRGKESLQLDWNQQDHFEPVEMLSLGNAVGTGGLLYEAPVIMVEDLAAFKRLTYSQAHGKIIFVNYHFRQDLISTFEGYSDDIWLRGKAPSMAASIGAAALIIRSLSTAPDAAPHTGALRYADTVKKIPAIAIGNTSADHLAAACKKQTVTARLKSEAMFKDSVLSYNVIGEIRGSDPNAGYIIAGGHLDSWDIGEGAHDDGAGVVQCIELIRTFKVLHIHPVHNIRAVLYMNEENGLKGGIAYADSARAKHEIHIVALETDAGGFAPRGIGLDMPERKKRKVQQWAPLFRMLNVYDLEGDEGGADVSPLKYQDVPLAGLVPDPQRYFDLHHSRNDVFEAVNHRELKLGAATIAAFVWMVDKYGL